MKIFRYTQIPLKYITTEIMEEYDIKNIAFNGYVYVEIRKGMYGLKETGIIAFNRLVSKLAPREYHPVKHTPGLWTHQTRNIHFTLAIYDFGVEYFNKQDMDNLFDILRQDYTISIY